MIKELTLEKAKDIYHNNLAFDFPKEEIKPFGAIERMWKQNGYKVLAYYDMDEFKGYAFLVVINSLSSILLDYLAICPKFREKGAGSTFISEIKSYIGSKNIIIESELCESAVDKKQLNIRKRRYAFYLKNSALMLSYRSSVHGVDYRLFSILGDNNGTVDENMLVNDYIALNKFMIKPEAFITSFKVEKYA